MACGKCIKYGGISGRSVAKCLSVAESIYMRIFVLWINQVQDLIALLGYKFQVRLYCDRFKAQISDSYLKLLQESAQAPASKINRAPKNLFI